MKSLFSFLKVYLFLMVVGFAMTLYFPSAYFASDKSSSGSGSSSGGGLGGGGGGGGIGGGGGGGGAGAVSATFGGGWQNGDGSGVTASGLSYSDTTTATGSRSGGSFGSGNMSVYSGSSFSGGSSFGGGGIGTGSIDGYDPNLSPADWVALDQPDEGDSILNYNEETGMYELPDVFNDQPETTPPTELAGPPAPEPSMPQFDQPQFDPPSVDLAGTDITPPAMPFSPNVSAPDLGNMNVQPANNTAIGNFGTMAGAIDFTSPVQTNYRPPNINYTAAYGGNNNSENNNNNSSESTNTQSEFTPTSPMVNDVPLEISDNVFTEIMTAAQGRLPNLDNIRTGLATLYNGVPQELTPEQQNNWDQLAPFTQSTLFESEAQAEQALELAKQYLDSIGVAYTEVNLYGDEGTRTALRIDSSDAPYTNPNLRAMAGSGSGFGTGVTSNSSTAYIDPIGIHRFGVSNGGQAANGFSSMGTASMPLRVLNPQAGLDPVVLHELYHGYAWSSDGDLSNLSGIYISNLGAGSYYDGASSGDEVEAHAISEVTNVVNAQLAGILGEGFAESLGINQDWSHTIARHGHLAERNQEIVDSALENVDQTTYDPSTEHPIERTINGETPYALEDGTEGNTEVNVSSRGSDRRQTNRVENLLENISDDLREQIELAAELAELYGEALIGVGTR